MDTINKPLLKNIIEGNLKIILLSIIFIINTLSYAQTQRNYSQELVNLLHQEKYFEAREFKSQYADLLPKNDKALDLVYNIHMSLAFNKPDSATVYLEEFLNNPDYEQITGPLKNAYYGRLVLTYEHLQQFKQSISAVEKQLSYLERNPFSMDQKFIENEIYEAKKKISSLREKLENEPLRHIVRASYVQDIQLKDSEYIRFDAKYNGQEIETFFDTGVSHFLVIEEDLAENIGVKINSNQNTTQTVNGRSVEAVEGIIDSIELKGIKLYNIPVAVFKEKFISSLPNNLNPELKLDLENKIFKNRQIIMGLPTIKMIGKFEFDWKENVLRLPLMQTPTKETPIPNFLLLRNTPYLNLKINEKDFVGFFDTGGNHYLYLTFSYLMSKTNDIKIDTKNKEQSFHITTLVGFHPNVKRYRVINPQIHFQNKNIEGSNQGVYVTETAWSHMNVFDGEVGVNFFKRNSLKTLLDFDTMMVKFID